MEKYFKSFLNFEQIWFYQSFDKLYFSEGNSIPFNQKVIEGGITDNNRQRTVQ